MPTFPDAPVNPQGLPNVERALRVIQTTPAVCVPEVASLPTAPKKNQLVVHAGALKWWNGSAWKTVTVT